MKIFALVLFLLVAICNTSYSSQIEGMDTLWSHYKTLRDDSLRVVELLNVICPTYKAIGSDSVVYFLEKAYQIAQENNDNAWFRFQMGNIGRETGNFYFRKSEFNRAVEFYHQSVEKYQKVIGESETEQAKPALKNMAGVFVNLGIVYSNLGNFDLAMENYYNALDSYEKMNDAAGMASCYLGIGNLKYFQGEFDKAIEDFEKSVKLYDKAGNKNGLANCYNNMGGIYYVKDSFDIAIDFFTKVLDLNKEVDNPKGISSAYTNLANVYINTGNHELAIDNFLRAMKIDEELGDLYNLTIVQVDLARLYFEIANMPGKAAADQKEKLNYALEFASKAYKGADEMEVIPLKNNISELLMRVNKALGKSEDALFFAEVFIATKDSMYHEEKTKAMAEMETKYEIAQKEEEIKRQRLMRNVALLGALLIFVLAYAFYRAKRLKQQSRQSRLEMEKMQLEQRFLRQQMNPHFIFNSMNSIQGFISSNNTYEAERYLSKFAGLIRLILENSAQSFIPLTDEIKSLQLYLELEQLRFSKKFEFSIHLDEIDEPEYFLVPPMLVQPYVENAIIHGIMHKETLGHIKISIRTGVGAKTLLCCIEDDGIGMEKALELKKERKSTHKSMGMQITRDRLSQLNRELNAGAGAVFTSLKDENGNAAGTRVDLVIPYEEE